MDLFRITRALYGIQHAIVTKSVKGYGIQEGYVCIDDEFSGLQTFLFYSKTEKFSGVQLGGIYSDTTIFGGYRVGLINYAENMDGVQLGLVNVSERLRGVQIGAVNIIKNSKLIPFMFGINFSW